MTLAQNCVDRFTTNFVNVAHIAVLKDPFRQLGGLRPMEAATASN